MNNPFVFHFNTNMNIYQGVNRRQVGGGIWSTISRGIRPLVISLLQKLKPHAVSAAKRVAHSAARVTSEMAMDGIQGKFNKERLKRTVKNEATDLTNDAMKSLKRKIDGEQGGTGNKRRKVTPKNKKTMKRKSSYKKRSGKGCRVKKGAIKRKVNRKQNKRKTKRGVKKRKSQSKRINRRVIKDIFK